MKKFSLKKITAAVSAAAMIATLGTSAFAADPASGAIEITNVLHSVSGNVHTFTIQYTAGDVQDIGITMFSYAGKKIPVLNKEDHDNFDASKALDSAEQPYKVVGVDQVANTTEKTGEISFKVSTDDKTAPIYMEEGQTGLVKLGGDKVNAPAIATFTIPESPWAITGVAASKSGTPVTEVTGINYNATVEEIATAIKNAIDKVTVTGANEKTADWTVPETLSGVTVDNYTPGKAGIFTAKVPLAQFRPSDAAATIGDVNELTFAVTVNKDIWTATSAQMADGGKYEKQLSDVTSDDVLENDIKTKKIKLIAEGKELTLDYNDTFIITKGDDNRVNGVGVVKYSVKVPAGTYSDANNEVTVPEAGVTADVEYEVKEVIDYSKIVNATFTVSNGSDVLTAPYGITVANKTTKDDAVKNITFALKNMAENPVDLVKDADYEVAWNGTYDAETAATYELTATITLKGDYKFEGGAATKEVKVSVTVQAAPAYKYGDITGAVDGSGNEIGDGEVDMNDVNKAFQFAMGNITLEDWQKAAADVATEVPDGEIAMNDVNSMFQYAMGNINKFPVEK